MWIAIEIMLLQLDLKNSIKKRDDKILSEPDPSFLKKFTEDPTIA